MHYSIGRFHHQFLYCTVVPKRLFQGCNFLGPDGQQILVHLSLSTAVFHSVPALVLLQSLCRKHKSIQELCNISVHKGIAFCMYCKLIQKKVLYTKSTKQFLTVLPKIPF